MNNSVIEIDLNELYPATKLIGEFTLSKLTVKNIFMEREVNCLYNRIEVADVSIPTSLHLTDPNNFITIKSDRLGLPALRSHTDIPIHANGIKFLIEADIGKIQNIVLGATGDKDSVQEIPIIFTVSQECKERSIYKDDLYSFKLLVKPSKAQLIIDYEPLLEQFEYEGAVTKHIGNLSFSLKKVHGYFYHEDFRVNIKLNEGVNRQVIEVDLSNVRRKLLSETSLKLPVKCRT